MSLTFEVIYILLSGWAFPLSSRLGIRRCLSPSACLHRPPIEGTSSANAKYLSVRG